MADESESPKSTMSQRSRKRSPSYPGIGLEESIRKAQALYEAEDTHVIPLEAAAAHWEYAPTSSSLHQAISALKQFGLLGDVGSGENRQIQLTDLAIDILLKPEDNQERESAIKTAALNPKIHREIWEKYGEKLPSDHSIRYYLLRERPDGVYFNKDSVDGFISQFRSTILFAGLSRADKIDGPGQLAPVTLSATSHLGAGTASTQPLSTAPSKPFQAVYGSGAEMRDLPVLLPSLEVAVLRVPVPMSENDFKTLVNTLNNIKDKLVTAVVPLVTKPSDTQE